MPRLENGGFLALALFISAAFAWVVQPFFGAILWGVVAAMLFAPLNQRVLRAMPGRRNIAALLTLIVIIGSVILPAIVIGMLLLQEATTFYVRIQSGEINVAAYFGHLQAMLPNWALDMLERLGLTNFAAFQETMAAGIANSFRTLAAQALLIGQSAFAFIVALGVMLYLTFFLLRDGDRLVRRIAHAAPLHSVQRQALADKFVVVIRATIKGGLVVAVIQGLVGGVVFWALGIQGALIWGVMMGFFSLLPAIGTGLIWVPVAIYLLASGQIWQGVAMILCGIFVIGMVDNVLRPILVGRDARMPDYVVLISTLGGLEVFGFNGFVVGPVIAALFIAVWNIMAEARHEQPAASSPTSS